MFRKKPKVVLVGGGMLAGLLYSMFKPDCEFLGYVDDIHDHAYVEKTYGLKNLGKSEDLPNLLAKDVKAVIAITDTAARQRYFEKIKTAGFSLATLVAKTAVVAESARVGAGCVIRHQAIVSPQVQLGENTVVSDSVYVGHDSIVGTSVYLAPGVNINGVVTIGDNTFLGTGAIVLPKQTIGKNCTVGAAACVTQEVKDNTTVVGVPARVATRKPEPPLVSVTMASYNHEKYVGAAIESVLAQTYPHWELIIVDDGSTDNTVKVIRQYNDPRIKAVFLLDNQGMIVAKRKCLDMAQGDYIAILNSDDLYLPEKLEKQVALLEQHPEISAALTLVEIIDDDGNRFQDEDHFYARIFEQPNRSRHEWLNYFFHNGNALCIPSALFRRSVYREIGYPDKRLLQLPDLDYWVRLCLHHDIHILQERLTKFRVRAGNQNASAPKPEAAIRDLWEFIHVLGHYLEMPDEKELVRIFPDTRQYLSLEVPLDSDMIAFILAQLALKKSDTRWQFFGMDTLFKLYADPSVSKKLQARFDFTYQDLIALTSRDVFHAYHLHEATQEITRLKQSRSNPAEPAAPISGEKAGETS